MKRHGKRNLVIILGLLLVGGLEVPTSADIELPEGYVAQVYADNISMPRSLAFDSQGYLYVTHDQVSSGQIYRISPLDQSVTMFGPFLKDPDSLVVDIRDRVLLGSGNGVIYRISFDEEATAIKSTLLDNVCALAIDRRGLWEEPGTLFAANAQSSRDILQINEDHQVDTYLNSQFFDIPYSMTFDEHGNLYVVEGSEEEPGLYRIDSNLNISLVHSFTAPMSLTVNSYLNELYVGDVEDEIIYKVTREEEVSIFAEDLSPYGLTFGPDGCLYVAERSVSPSQIIKIAGFPQPLAATVDLDPDIIMISDSSDWDTDGNEVSLTAHIELPQGYPVSGIDANEISLQIQGYPLSTASMWTTEGDLLKVRCQLEPTYLGKALGVEITSLRLSDTEEALEIHTYDALNQLPDLIQLKICGPFQDAHGFSGTDTIRIMANDQNEDTE